MAEQENEKRAIPWGMFWLVAGAYLPVLIMASMYFNLFGFGRINIPEESKKQIKEEIETQVKKATSENSPGNGNIIVQTSKNEPVVREYIRSQIATIAKDQAESAAQDEIEKAKGELFEQISFPVLAAIVSIFAAFIVKDIFTEILKKGERDEITRKLREELKSNIVPEAVKANELVKRLRNSEIQLNWLEHELLKIEIIQTLDTSYPLLISHAEETQGKILESVKCLLNRLNQTSSGFELPSEDLVQLRKFERQILEPKIRNLNLGKETENELLLTVDESFQASRSDASKKIATNYEFEEEIFEVQLSFLIATLAKLGDKGLMIEAIQFIYDRSKKDQEALEKQRKYKSNADLNL
jgi:hypothetical protein